MNARLGFLARITGAALLLVVIFAIWPLGLGFAGGSTNSGELIVTSARPARVTGFVAARVPQKDIFIPNVTASLRKPSGRTVAAVKSDLSGHFEFPSVRPGKLRLCLRAAGFASHCTAPFAMASVDHFLTTQLLRLANKPGTVSFYGQAQFRDGSNPRTWDPTENVDAFATVTPTARGGAPVGPAALVNDYGDYIVAGVPARKTAALRGRIERTRSVVKLPRPAKALRHVDITLPNKPPEIAGIVANTGSGDHWSAPLGAHVKLKAVTRDPNGNKVTVRWTLPDGTSPPVKPGSHTIAFTLPSRAGMYEFDAVASDGRGGYATDSISISTHGVRFSGIVRATNAPFVAGATVQIGTASTVTDVNGRYQLTVPEAPRYAVNVSKLGYMPVSAITDRGVLGGRWTLTRASVTTVNPTETINVSNQRIPTDCPGPLSAPHGKKQPCGPGISVSIPANSLVNSSGLPPTGPVTIALATVDQSAGNQLPGDFTARDADGNESRFESLGAGFIEITAGSTVYNLKSGATATVTVPVDRQQLAAGAKLPASIPLLTYVTTPPVRGQKPGANQQGVWTSDSTAERAGNAYVATVPHFSFVSLNVQTPGSACLRVDAVAMPNVFDLQVTGKDSTTSATITKTEPMDNSGARFHVVNGLVPNDTIELRAFVHGTTTPIKLALPNPTGANPPPTGTVLTATSGGSAPIHPDFPYVQCHGFAGTTPGPLPSAVLVQNSLPKNVVNEFLYLGAAPAENLTAKPGLVSPYQAQTTRYYNKVDPLHLRLNVGDFRTRNHYGAGELQAAYSNSGDLGFGREMHCQRHKDAGVPGFDIACYVTNYGNKDSDDFDDFVQAETALGSTVKVGAVASVGMEFSRIEDPSDPTGNTFVNNTRVLKFYVWGGPPATAGDQLVTSANLDGLGARPVPQLCSECHGGSYSGPTQANGLPKWTTASVNLHSNFIPFDLRSLDAPVVGTTDFTATQQPVFKALNKTIVLGALPGMSVRKEIAAMYAGGSATQKKNGLPAGWKSKVGSPSPHDLYLKVVAESCRSCHYSQDPSGGRSPLDWDTAKGFNNLTPLIASFVCETQAMPHALITHRRFWLARPPNQPRLLREYLRDHNASLLVTKTCH